MKKYEQGEPIKDIIELIREMGQGHIIFLRDQPKHPSFITHMTFDTVLIFLNGGQLCKAKSVQSAAKLPVHSAEEQKEIYLRIEASRVRLMNPVQRLGYWLGLTWRVLVGRERLM